MDVNFFSVSREARVKCIVLLDNSTGKRSVSYKIIRGHLKFTKVNSAPQIICHLQIDRFKPRRKL